MRSHDPSRGQEADARRLCWNNMRNHMRFGLLGAQNAQVCSSLRKSYIPQSLLPPLSPLFCVRAQDGERSTARGLSTDVDWLSVPGHFEYIFSIHSAVEWVRRRFFDKFPEVCNSYFKSFPLAMAVD